VVFDSVHEEATVVLPNLLHLGPLYRQGTHVHQSSPVRRSSAPRSWDLSLSNGPSRSHRSDLFVPTAFIGLAYIRNGHMEVPRRTKFGTRAYWCYATPSTWI